MNSLDCEEHDLPLEKIRVTKGDGKDEVLLGYFYACPVEGCNSVVDADMDGNPIFEEWEQLELEVM